VDARVADLKANPRNPRRISPERAEQLARSLAAEPDMLRARPLLARADGTVFAGNQRLEAARRLGWETVPTVFVTDLDEVREAYWMFLDNRAFGEDDDDLAAELLAELNERGGDLDLTGYTRAETDGLLRRLVRRELEPDELPSLPDSEPASRLGEVFELGRHRLMCGDATDHEHVAELLRGEEPLLVATDPPYGVRLDNGWRDRVGLNRSAPRRRGAGRAEHRATSIASDSVSDWSVAYEHVPSCRVMYVWHASVHACEVQAGLERVGFEVKQQLVWDKGAFALSRADYNWGHEPCFYAKRGGARVPWYGPANQSTLWSAPSPKMMLTSGRGRGDGKVDHPTQKPVALFTRPIENHLQHNEVLYDPFAGSGTALIAAELTGRRCLAMELDPRCCDLIRARFEEFCGGR
jgi:DNA modification methylase